MSKLQWVSEIVPPLYSPLGANPTLHSAGSLAHSPRLVVLLVAQLTNLYLVPARRDLQFFEEIVLEYEYIPPKNASTGCTVIVECKVGVLMLCTSFKVEFEASPFPLTASFLSSV